MSIFQLTGDNAHDDVTIKQGQKPGELFNTNIGVVTNPNEISSADAKKDEVTPEGDNPTIVLDGPLSRIYHEALNVVLANEDTGTMYNIMEAERRDRKEWKDDNTQKATYVYTDNADSITPASCVDITNFIFANKDKGDLVISLESHGKISRHIGLVESLAKDMGIKLHYSRSKALEAIRMSATTKKV